MSADGPILLGLTGSIGMGKSTVAGMFAEMGVPVFDADAEVRAMQGPGGSLLTAIEAAFPGSTDTNGVRREALGAEVFGNPAALARLESIVHPAVAVKRREFLLRNIDAPVLLFDVPLLFEKGADYVDQVVVVSAPEAVQRARVLARPGMSEQKFAAIRASQMPDAMKRERADHLIDTGTTLAETRAQVGQLLSALIA